MKSVNSHFRRTCKVIPLGFLLTGIWWLLSGGEVIRQEAGSDLQQEGTNWPFFRGEGSRGIAVGFEYQTKWDGVSGTNIKWKVNIPGEGKSSPVIWGDNLFLTTSVDSKCEVLCFSKESGEQVWRYISGKIAGEPETLPEMDKEAGLAVSTAATNGEVVCSVFANGNLICLSTEGKLKWAVNIGVPRSSYGYSSSLIIFKNILIVQYDSNEKISLLGFDLINGNLLWETPRRGNPAWSSPVLADFDGKSMVIINGNPEVAAFDPVTGKELWAVRCMTGDVVPSVAVNSKYVYAVTDYARLAAIRPGTGASIIWDDNSYTPDVSSPVANDEFLFVATGNGDVVCYNQENGDTLWTHYFNCQFYASPVIAGDLVYLPDRSGGMHIVSAGKTFTLIGEPSLGEPTDCTPAFSDKKLYIRSAKNLYCISKN